MRKLILPKSVLFALAALTLLATLACSKKTAPTETINPLDHADSTRVQPINFLHKTFQVKKYAQFAFEVPPHNPLPRLHGTFRSFVPRTGDDPLSDDTTNVDFLLLNTDQFDDFSHGHSEGTALYSTEPTHDHEVDFRLSPTGETSAKYYVVFRNSPGGAAVKSVQADFTLSFGY